MINEDNRELPVWIPNFGRKFVIDFFLKNKNLESFKKIDKK